MKKETAVEPEVFRPSLLGLLLPYRGILLLLILLTIGANALNLAVPKLIAYAIDAYAKGTLVLSVVGIEFGIIAFFIFALTYLQSIAQTYASERVARDLRRKLSAHISLQENAFVESVGAPKLLTNLTSDVDAVKSFVAQAIASIISSVFLIIGASVLLLYINWKLGLAVLAVMPIIATTFYIVLGRVRKLFRKSQEAIDWLNKVINESILGAALVRLLNSQSYEREKFTLANTEARNIGLNILSLFATLIPVITFATNLATLIILTLGGHFVIQGTMSLGDFTAFNTYLAILIFPILIIGFMSNVIAQATASYQRIGDVLISPVRKDTGTINRELTGHLEVKNLSLTLAGKQVLKDISFAANPGTRTAILGPTAAGKTQLLYLLTGLLTMTEGVVLYDGALLGEYKKESFHKQVGLVFQDSIIFNLTLRENIAFSNAVEDAYLKKAIETAELQDFITSLPNGLDTIVSERGTSLSGGQKQRIMLARALTLNPRFLLLDDFTARVDLTTEAKILGNVRRSYPGLTLISVTQKIAPVEDYDQIILLMEGEILARGTHSELMKTSPEYVQIYSSQQSTEAYENDV